MREREDMKESERGRGRREGGGAASIGPATTAAPHVMPHNIAPADPPSLPTYSTSTVARKPTGLYTYKKCAYEYGTYNLILCLDAFGM